MRLQVREVHFSEMIVILALLNSLGKDRAYPRLLTAIRLIFVVKIFSYAENIRNYFTRNFCYNEYFSDEYLEQSTCAYAVHAVFVALRILEGYIWLDSICRYLKPIDGLPDQKGSLSTTIPSTAIAFANWRIDISLNLVAILPVTVQRIDVVTSHTASHRPLFHAITQSAYYLQRVYNYIFV